MTRFNQCDIRFSQDFSLKQVSWQIQAGEVWAILGPNGSGKSALAASLAGEGEITSGEFERSYQSVGLVSLEEQARLIAREQARDDSDLTDEVSDGTPVSEMLDEVCLDHGLQSQLVEQLKLMSLRERGFRKLSTGETRKILLVRAITSKPDLLVLDEPFEGLDAQTVPEVTSLLREISMHTPLVMVFNRIDEIPDFVTGIVYVEDGRIRHRFECVDDVSQTKALLAQFSHLKTVKLCLPRAESLSTPPLNEDGSLVRLVNGTVSYIDNVVFEGLDWTIKPSEHWQVSGPNGSGKTCLLNLVTGDHPQCYVNDLQIFGFRRGQGETIWDIKRYIGYVSTALHWDYRLGVSVRNVIVSGFYDSIGLYQKATELQLQIADEWLSVLKLQERARVPFSSLSYGEQRLLLIARAMVKHPPILLLDEPCLGLDELNRQLVLALIEKIGSEGNTTLVYVTHHEEDEIPGIENKLSLS